MNDFKCMHCGKVFPKRSSIVMHERFCKLNPIKIPKEMLPLFGRIPWNKGLHQPDEVKKKISKALTKPKVEKICPICDSVFFGGNATCGNNNCISILRYKNTDPISKSAIMSEVAKRRHKLGDTSFGYQTRKKFKPSYPESIAIRCLDEIGISYIREFRVDRYFIDFAIMDRMLAIEIDGSQHLREDRKKSDIRKDDKLKELGWTVVRIQYPSQNIRAELSKLFLGNDGQVP